MRLDHIIEHALDEYGLVADASPALGCISSEYVRRPFMARRAITGLPDDISVLEPPEPIPNSAVKRHSADGSVGFPHVRVGRCQASIFFSHSDDLSTFDTRLGVSCGA